MFRIYVALLLEVGGLGKQWVLFSCLGLGVFFVLFTRLLLWWSATESQSHFQRYVLAAARGWHGFQLFTFTCIDGPKLKVPVQGQEFEVIWSK